MVGSCQRRKGKESANVAGPGGVQFSVGSAQQAVAIIDAIHSESSYVY